MVLYSSYTWWFRRKVEVGLSTTWFAVLSPLSAQNVVLPRYDEIFTARIHFGLFLWRVDRRRAKNKTKTLQTLKWLSIAALTSARSACQPFRWKLDSIRHYGRVYRVWLYSKKYGFCSKVSLFGQCHVPIVQILYKWVWVRFVIFEFIFLFPI